MLFQKKGGRKGGWKGSKIQKSPRYYYTQGRKGGKEKGVVGLLLLEKRGRETEPTGAGGGWNKLLLSTFREGEISLLALRYSHQMEWLWQKSRAEMICLKNLLASLGVRRPFFTR